MRRILPIIYLIIPLWVQAQSPKIYKKMKALYPHEAAIYLDLHQEVEIDIDGDSILIISEQYYDMLHLDEQSKVMAKDKIYLSHFKELLSVEAKTLIPHKNKYNTLTVSDFKEKNETSAGIFYDDFKSKTFVYPAVQEGARTILSEKQAITNPRFLTAFYFGSFVPVVSTHFQVKFHKDIELNFRKFNMENLEVAFQKEEKGDYWIYRWEASSLAPYQIQGQAPKSSYYLPHIAYHIASYRGESGPQRVLSDVGDLYGWYSQLTSQTNKQPTEELQQLVNALTQGATSEEEKVRRLFYWVQDNIKYIAFEDGMRGLIPHDAAYVYSKRYGDCKDMASITNKMLQLAGIESYLTWIGSRDLPYRYSELPTPMVDNHMIVSYRRPNGELYFLDATSSDTRYGMPSSMIQGKEALLDLGKGKYEIAEVPVISRKENQVIDSSYLTLEQGELVGKGSLELFGYVRVFNAYRITGKKDKKEDRFMRGFLQKGNNKCFIEEYTFQNLDDKEAPLAIRYDFRVKDYHQQVGNEIYINLHLEKPFENDLIEAAERTVPLENPYCYTNTEVIAFEVPNGYKVSYIPENATFEHPLFGFDLAYQQEGHIVYLHREVYKNYLLLEQPHFQEWNSMVKSLSQAYREVIILEKDRDDE